MSKEIEQNDVAEEKPKVEVLEEKPKVEVVEENPKVEVLEEKAKVEVTEEKAKVEPTEEKPKIVEAEEKEPEIKTKQSFRERIWVYMAKEKLTKSFRSLCSRIPYFNGYDEATRRLTELDEFKEAKLVMISPDKPQESVIISSLLQKKEVLIPRPRLLNGLFYRVKSATELPEEETKHAIIRYDIKQIQTPVTFNTKDIEVDMVILGSVCVNKAGYRIGVGEGFVDLEYAILSKMKAVNENTIIVTTVHDCQILDDIPNEIFEPHDVPVDMIITPTQVIVCNPKLSKPNEIIWPNISKRRLESIPILKEIKEFEEKEGKSLSLKEDDSDVELRLQERIRIKKIINKLKPRSRRTKSNSENRRDNDKSKEMRRRPFIRRRGPRKSKENTGNNNTDKPSEMGNLLITKSTTKPSRSRTNWARHQIDFSLRLSNIASTVRVRDLKSALLERGVKPSNITWRGQRGFCYLHFGKLRKRDSPENQPIQVDSIVANLQQLKIGDETPEAPSAFITVEPAEPVSRIEVVDVTTV